MSFRTSRCDTEPHRWRLPTADQYTDALYAGPKAHLRPVHDAALATLLDLGDDVEVEGRQSYITVRRARQVGLLVPATRSRIDLGLRFLSEPEHPWLAKAKSLGQCTGSGLDRSTTSTTD